jgi:HEPN domain-containing protein
VVQPRAARLSRFAVELLEEAGETVPEALRSAARLSRFAVEPRYPGFGRPVSEEEYQALLGVAREVVRWAEQRVAELLR